MWFVVHATGREFEAGFGEEAGSLQKVRRFLISRGRSLLLLLLLSRNVAEAGVEKEGWSEACRWLKVGKYRKS